MQLKNALFLVVFLVLGIGSGLLLGRYVPSLFKAAQPEAVEQGNFAEHTTPTGKPIVMFSRTGCPYCQQAREYFAMRGIAYAEHVIDQSADAMATFERMGEKGVPVILTAKHKIRGFDPHLMTPILEEDGVLPKAASAPVAVSMAAP